jgi:DNA-directed RNA polymerase subunit E'/Rpb7
MNSVYIKRMDVITDLKDLYIPQIIYIKEGVQLSDLNMDIATNTSNVLDVFLEDKIRKKIGGKCMNVGYIDKNSIKVVSRSIGKMNTSHFNGEIYYQVQLECKVCKPVSNQVIETKIVGKNKIGILCISGPLQIIIPSSHHEDASFYNSLNKDDVIYVRIINYKFQLNDDNIKVIAEYVGKK